jgi:hypothetical protein
MAELVVDALEVIDVEHDHRQRSPSRWARSSSTLSRS